MNIDILNQTLEVTESPGLETLDPRFMDITTLVQSGDYLGAAAQAEGLLEEGVYDIRTTGYFLYGVFLEQGIGAMTAVLGCLTNLLTENWEALGPTENRAKHCQDSFGWFLRQLVKKLQYEEEKQSDIWQQWVAEISSDDVQEALDTGEEFQKAVGMTLGDEAGPLLEGWSKVNEWLRAFQGLVYREPEPELEAEEAEAEPEAEPEAGEAEAEPKEMIAAPSAAAVDDAAYAEASYHLQLLLTKMEAFKRLIDNEQFTKAAIVADDINETIANFDPRVYFPRMFSKYSLLLALNIGELTAFEQYKGSVEWQTMQDLYKVDLESFVSLDSETTYSASPGGEEYPGEEDHESEEYEEEGYDESEEE
jgi:hypothetical protein